MPESRDLEKEITEQAKTISSLTRENLQLKKSLRGYKGLASVKGHQHDHAETENKQELPEKTPETLSPPVHFKPWMKVCPECGDKNPDFLDETVCDLNQGGCGAHLGSVETAKDLKFCPSCGGTKVNVLPRAVEKARRLGLVK